MSRINFEDLTADNPKVDDVLKRLDAWLEQHPDKEVIDPRELARAWKDVGPETLADALTFLVRQRCLVQVYKVETPSGVLTREEFDSPLRVPEEVDGPFNRKVDTAEGTVLPVFRKVGSDEHN